MRDNLGWHEKLLLFLGRPLGGFELEAFICVFGELWFGVVLAISEKGAWYTTALRPVYGVVPGPVLSIPWFVAAGLTILGFVRFARGDSRCVPLRIAGAAISMWLWFWVAATTNWTTAGEAPYCGFFVGAAMAQFRFMMGAWHRKLIVWGRE